MELKNDIGASTCWSLSCVKTTTYDVSDENVYKVKGLRKLWATKNGAMIIDCFIKSNASLSLCPHLKTYFFLIMVHKGKTICEKLGTNIFTKFICPRNDCVVF